MKNNVIELNFRNTNAADTDVVEATNKINKTVVQSNPIYKQMLAFHNTKIGEKFSISDLLR